jgi:hypothetical protein
MMFLISEYVQHQPSSWLGALLMFWAQFTAILRALASNTSFMAARLSQSFAAENHKCMNQYDDQSQGQLLH